MLLSVVLRNIREPVWTKQSVSCYSVSSGNVTGRSTLEFDPQNYQRNCQDKVQLSVFLRTIREPVRTKCSRLWSSEISGNLFGQIEVECGPQKYQGTC